MMEKQKIKVTGLRNALRRFEYNGRYAQSGDWTIANGVMTFNGRFAIVICLFWSAVLGSLAYVVPLIYLQNRI